MTMSTDYSSILKITIFYGDIGILLYVLMIGSYITWNNFYNLKK